MSLQLTPLTLMLLCLLMFAVALLYASVGHGGASGYLAVLSLLPAASAAMATSALVLNVLVAGIALWRFSRAGFLAWRLTWPFLLASVPAAYVGGRLPVSGNAYAVLLGLALLVAAWRLTVVPPTTYRMNFAPALAMALPVGAGIGLLSGIVGIGGGIFLSPLFLLRRWAGPKETAATSAYFIVVNSLAALVGRAGTSQWLLGRLWPLVVVAGVGGWIGATLGANHFSGAVLRRLLAAVLVLASLKLLWRNLA